MTVPLHRFQGFLLGCIASTVIILCLQAKHLFVTDMAYVEHGLVPINRRTQLSDGYDRSYLQSANRPPRMLVGVFTTVEEKNRRQKLRDYIFKNPSRMDSRLCSLDEFMQRNLPAECQVIYTFVVGANMNPKGPLTHTDKSQMPILVNPKYLPEVESDVTYLNIRENMNKGKTPTWFKYASKISSTFGENSIDYIAKLDSDTLISIPNLLDMLNYDLPTVPRNVYGGIVCDEKACGDPERCHKILQGKIYMTGQFYFISHDLASYISDDKLDRASISQYSEDVDLGMWVHSSNRILKMIVLNNKNVFWIHNTKDNEKIDQKYQDYFVKQRKFPMYTFWLKPKWWD